MRALKRYAGNCDLPIFARGKRDLSSVLGQRFGLNFFCCWKSFSHPESSAGLLASEQFPWESESAGQQARGLWVLSHPSPPPNPLRARVRGAGEETANISDCSGCVNDFKWYFRTGKWKKTLGWKNEICNCTPSCSVSKLDGRSTLELLAIAENLVLPRREMRRF